MIRWGVGAGCGIGLIESKREIHRSLIDESSGSRSEPLLRVSLQQP